AEVLKFYMRPFEMEGDRKGLPPKWMRSCMEIYSVQGRVIAEAKFVKRKEIPMHPLYRDPTLAYNPIPRRRRWSWILVCQWANVLGATEQLSLRLFQQEQKQSRLRKMDVAIYMKDGLENATRIMDTENDIKSDLKHIVTSEIDNVSRL
ncbi:hypothetical protein Tco_1240811, partial [Tanacetum coccineum]